MINETATFFEGFAKDLGLSIKIPRPGKTARKAFAITNSAVGVGLVATGAVFSSKALVGLGILGLAGAAVLALEKREG
jgi:hypothetical protein